MVLVIFADGHVGRPWLVYLRYAHLVSVGQVHVSSKNRGPIVEIAFFLPLAVRESVMRIRDVGAL